MANVNSRETAKFNTLLVYGESGSGKTMEVAAIAWYILEKYKKRTRLVSTDGGGWGTLQPYIDAGVIDGLNLAADESPLTKLHEVAAGYWPNSEGKWFPKEQQTEWDSIGMYAIEGLSSMSSLLMQYLIDDGRRIAEDVVAKFTISDEDTGNKLHFGAASRSHYGFVQSQVLSIIGEFQGLLNNGIDQLIFTSLESSGEDKISKRATLGPSAAGQALTPILPQRVGDLIHFEKVKAQGKDKDKNETIEYRAYFTGHIDPEVNRVWPCKLRLSPQLLAAAKVDPLMKNGYIVLDEEEGRIDRQGLSKLFRWRDEQSSEVVQKMRERVNEILGGK